MERLRLIGCRVLSLMANLFSVLENYMKKRVLISYHIEPQLNRKRSNFNLFLYPA